MSNPNLQMCFICHLRFPTETFSQHYQTHHLNPQTTATVFRVGLSDDAPFYCYACHDMLRNKEYYIEHVLSVHKESVFEAYSYLMNLSAITAMTAMTAGTYNQFQFPVQPVQRAVSPPSSDLPALSSPHPSQPARPPRVSVRPKRLPQSPPTGPWDSFGFQWNSPIPRIDSHGNWKFVCGYGCNQVVESIENAQRHYEHQVKNKKMIVYNGSIRCLQ